MTKEIFTEFVKIIMCPRRQEQFILAILVYISCFSRGTYEQVPSGIAAQIGKIGLKGLNPEKIAEKLEQMTNFKNVDEAKGGLGDVGYNPHYGYEPYWEGGDWIIKPIEPSNDMVDENVTTTTTSTTPIPSVCGEDCDRFYRKIGPVCARLVVYEIEFNAWNRIWPRNEDHIKRADTYFQTFPTYCEFLNYKCHTNGTKKAVSFLMGRACPKYEQVVKPLLPGKFILDRIKSNMERLKNVFEKSSLPPPFKEFYGITEPHTSLTTNNNVTMKNIPPRELKEYI